MSEGPQGYRSKNLGLGAIIRKASLTNISGSGLLAGDDATMHDRDGCSGICESEQAFLSGAPCATIQLLSEFSNNSKPKEGSCGLGDSILNNGSF